MRCHHPFETLGSCDRSEETNAIECWQLAGKTLPLYLRMPQVLCIFSIVWAGSPSANLSGEPSRSTPSFQDSIICQCAVVFSSSHPIQRQFCSTSWYSRQKNEGSSRPSAHFYRAAALRTGGVATPTLVGHLCAQYASKDWVYPHIARASAGSVCYPLYMIDPFARIMSGFGIPCIIILAYFRLDALSYSEQVGPGKCPRCFSLRRMFTKVQ